MTTITSTKVLINGSINTLFKFVYMLDLICPNLTLEHKAEENPAKLQEARCTLG